MNAHAERKRLRLAIAPGITVPEATGLSERYRLVNDGKANQSDYSGDRDTLGKHLMGGSGDLPPGYEACNRPTQAGRVEV